MSIDRDSPLWKRLYHAELRKMGVDWAAPSTPAPTFGMRIAAGFKALARMVFPGAGGRWGSAPWRWNVTRGRGRDYAAAVGDGGGSAIVQACVLWLCRTFPEAPVQVQRRNAKAQWEPIEPHRMTDLLDNPNPWYSGPLLWWGTLADWMVSGNAYWRVIPSAAGLPVQLWWIPSALIEPRWPDDGSVYISHYDYTPNADVERIDPAQVIHFRYGLDPANTRKGLSPLASLLREIFTDEEASAFSAAMLSNLGVPGVVLAPDGDAQINQDAADEMKTAFAQKFSGDRRGEPLVMADPIKVSVLSFSPQQMSLKDMRRLPEERVTAIFGTPAVVVGLGAGLDRSTFANFAEAREAAYESNMIPTQRLLAAELKSQLLPLFEGEAARALRVAFDLSGVRVLQEDQDKLFARALDALRGGGITHDQYAEMIGQEPLPNGQGAFLYVPIAVTPTTPADLLAPPDPQPMPLPGGAGATVPRAAGVIPPSLLRALPEAKAGGLDGSLRRMRTRLEAALRRDVAKLLARAPDDPEGHEVQIGRALRRSAGRVLIATHGVLQDAAGETWELPDDAVDAYYDEAAAPAAGIAATTRERLAGKGRKAEGDDARADTIAATEVTREAVLAMVLAGRASNLVTGFLVRDGDYDDACAARDGLEVELSGTIPELNHPNCTVSIEPIFGKAAPRELDRERAERRVAAVERRVDALATTLAERNAEPPPPQVIQLSPRRMVRKKVQRDRTGAIVAVIEEEVG